MQPLSGNQRPDLLTSLMDMTLVLRLPPEIHSSFHILCKCPKPAIAYWILPQSPHVLLTFDKVHNPSRLPCKTTSERSNVVRAGGAFNILPWKRASRQKSVQFFDMSACKSGPGPWCASYILNHFDLEMCFASQGRPLFRHIIFQTCSDPGAFCTF